MNYASSCKILTELKKEKKWLEDISSVVAQQSLRNLDAAFSNFFKKRAAFPKFKSKKRGGSARYLDNAFRIKDGKLFLAKMESSLEVCWSCEMPSMPNSCTISLNPTGEWYASFLCEQEIKKLPKTEKRVGIDLGISCFATLSDGKVFYVPKNNQKNKIKKVETSKEILKEKERIKE